MKVCQLLDCYFLYIIIHNLNLNSSNKKMCNYLWIITFYSYYTTTYV